MKESRFRPALFIVPNTYAMGATRVCLMGIGGATKTGLKRWQALTTGRSHLSQEAIMAYITSTAKAPFGAETVLFIVNRVTDAFEAAIAWNNERKTRNILAQLSPEQMYDIGLRRD